MSEAVVLKSLSVRCGGVLAHTVLFVPRLPVCHDFAFGLRRNEAGRCEHLGLYEGVFCRGKFFVDSAWKER